MTETQTKQTTIEQLEEELTQLRETEESLLGEGAELPEKLASALEAERSSWAEAAVAGGKAEAERTAGVTERGLDISRQLWAVRVRQLETSVELREARIEEHEATRKEAEQQAARIREKQADLQRELLQKSGVVEEARWRTRELKHKLRDEEAQLVRLRKAGPDHAMTERRR